MINKIELKNIYYRNNQAIPGYIDILFETDRGIFKHNVTSLDKVDEIDSESFIKMVEIEDLKKLIGVLFINEIRITYDNSMYILLSGKVILAIEYVLNSDIGSSLQEIRFIDSLDNLHKSDLDFFYELDIVALPNIQ